MTRTELKLECFKIAQVVLKKNEYASTKDILTNAKIIYQWAIENSDDLDIFKSEVLSEKTKNPIV